MAVGLNGRVGRLERSLLPEPPAEHCRAYGLPHVRLPIPVSMVEAIVARNLDGKAVEVPRLCLCLPCCTDGRAIARLTHGLTVREGV